MTEIELLRKIRKNPADFSVLFNLYYKSIFGYIFRRTGVFDDSADMAAETFLKAFRAINNFSYRGISVKTWLYRIATNELNQHFRKSQKYNSLFLRLDFENEALFNTLLEDDKMELEKELQQHEQFLAVLKELRKLPHKYQEVISLRYFEGKENKEIAEILQMNEGTLKSLLSRGLEKLRVKCNQI